MGVWDSGASVFGRLGFVQELDGLRDLSKAERRERLGESIGVLDGGLDLLEADLGTWVVVKSGALGGDYGNNSGEGDNTLEHFFI